MTHIGGGTVVEEQEETHRGGGGGALTCKPQLLHGHRASVVSQGPEGCDHIPHPIGHL
jgi:hypothetical protein